MDVLLRCMEDEKSDSQDFAFNCQVLLSRMWVSDLYEVARLLNDRKPVKSNSSFDRLNRELTVIRVSLDKHEIASERSLKEPLAMGIVDSAGKIGNTYEYRRDDLARGHTMRLGLSELGSVMWEGLDAKNREAAWVERRDLADRFLKIFRNG